MVFLWFFLFLCFFLLLESQTSGGLLASVGANDGETLRYRSRDGNANLHLGQIAGVHEVGGDDLQTALQRSNTKFGTALQTDLQQIHVSRGECTVGVDVGEAPLHGGEDGQDVSLGRDLRSVAEALLLQSGRQPRSADLGRRVIKGTRQSLPARHLLSAVGTSEVDLHASVELAQRSVEELAGRVGAAVAEGAGSDALLVSSGKLTLQEAADLLGHLVGDEEGLLLLHDGDLIRGGGGGRLVPRVLILVVLRGQEEVVDEELEDGLLVGGGRVGLHDGDNLVHGVVEEGGADLGEEGLNCGDGVRHFLCLETRRRGMWMQEDNHDICCIGIHQSIFSSKDRIGHARTKTKKRHKKTSLASQAGGRRPFTSIVRPLRTALWLAAASSQIFYR